MAKKLASEFDVEEATIIQEGEQAGTSEDNETVAPVEASATDLSLELVKNSVPVIPTTLNVYGVLISETLIQAEIEKIKKMKIANVHDKKGIKAVETAIAKMVKIRTQPEKWRKEVTAPITKFSSDLKAQTDKFGELSKKGVEEGNKILQPILDEIERLENEAELKREEDLKARKALLIEAGASTVDGNIFTFDYNANLFFNGTLMKEFTQEEWDSQYAIVLDAFKIESDRLQAIQDEKDQKENQLNEKEVELQNKQIKLHEKELRLSDFVEQPDGTWTKGDVVITPEQIKTLEGDEWDAAIADPIEEPVQEVAPVTKTSGGGSSFSVERPAAKTEPAPKPDLAGDFAVEDDEEFNPEEEQQGEAPKVIVVGSGVADSSSVITRSLVFSPSKPYVEYAVGDKFAQRIYPNSFEEKASAGIDPANIRYSGAVNDQLSFILIQVV